MTATVFITATDTDAGKTWVTNTLIQSLLQQNIQAKALKPIACGLNKNGENEDVSKLLKTQGLQKSSDINLYCFEQPAAPSIAAYIENKPIDISILLRWCEQQISRVDICLIEAIGGLMVPLQKQYLVSDWLQDMPKNHLILVVSVKLGCINHALLSLDKLKGMQRPPSWIIINNIADNQDTQVIAAAIQPYLTKHTRMLICEHNQPETLKPITKWLQALS